jgi:hypothetical protein
MIFPKNQFLIINVQASLLLAVLPIRVQAGVSADSLSFFDLSL